MVDGVVSSFEGRADVNMVDGVVSNIEGWADVKGDLDAYMNVCFVCSTNSAMNNCQMLSRKMQNVWMEDNDVPFFYQLESRAMWTSS